MAKPKDDKPDQRSVGGMLDATTRDGAQSARNDAVNAQAAQGRVDAMTARANAELAAQAANTAKPASTASSTEVPAFVEPQWNENMSFDELANVAGKYDSAGRPRPRKLQNAINAANAREKKAATATAEPVVEESTPAESQATEDVATDATPTEDGPASTEAPDNRAIEGAQGMMAVINSEGNVQMIPKGSEMPEGYGPPDLNNPQIAQLVADAEAAHEASVQNPHAQQEDAISAAEEITGRKMDSKQKNAFMTFLAQLGGSETEGMTPEQLANYEKIHGKQTIGRRIGNIGDALLRGGMAMQGASSGKSAKEMRAEQTAGYQQGQMEAGTNQERTKELKSMDQDFTMALNDKQYDQASATMQQAFENAKTMQERTQLFDSQQKQLDRLFADAQADKDVGRQKSIMHLQQENAMGMLALGNEFNQQLARLTTDLSIEQQRGLNGLMVEIGQDPAAREALAQWYATQRTAGNLTAERVQQGFDIALTGAQTAKTAVGTVAQFLPGKG
jgi:hypothetical protein